MLVVEAQLTVLLRLVLSGPPAGRAAAAQQLFSAQVLSKLAMCTALDVQPEEPGYAYVGGERAPGARPCAPGKPSTGRRTRRP
jgi:hypothetical protein